MKTTSLFANAAMAIMVAGSRINHVHGPHRERGNVGSATTLATVAASSVSPKDESSPINIEARNSAISPGNLSPNGNKAGLSGYVGIQNTDAFDALAPYISWYSDYTSVPPNAGNVTGIGMLWGATGSPCGNVVNQRLKQFEDTFGGYTPSIMFGFYEPDCHCSDSSNMSTAAGTAQWNKLLAPLGNRGTVLGSPSMCKQKDENWLKPFIKGGITRGWDVTSIHINKPNITGVMQDVEYYAATYGKPIWVSEFACVHDNPTFQPCTDQGEINQFINDAVQFFNSNSSVVAYGPSNGAGLGNVWPLTNANGELTASGTTYLNAIKNL